MFAPPSLAGAPTGDVTPIDVDLNVPGVPSEAPAPVAAVTRVDSRLDAQFCPPPGESETITFKHTLGNWLRVTQT